MSKRTADTNSKEQVGCANSLERIDDELETVVGGTSAARRATDLRTEKAKAEGGTASGRFSQIVWQ